MFLPHRRRHRTSRSLQPCCPAVREVDMGKENGTIYRLTSRTRTRTRAHMHRQGKWNGTIQRDGEATRCARSFSRPAGRALHTLFADSFLWHSLHITFAGASIYRQDDQQLASRSFQHTPLLSILMVILVDRTRLSSSNSTGHDGLAWYIPGFYI